MARAIALAASARGLDPIAAKDVQIVPGRGLRGVVHGESVAAGSAALMCELGWELPPALSERADVMASSGHSVVFVGWSENAGAGRARAALSFDDTPLPEARATIDALRGLGLRVMLLSGDHAGAAARVAATVGMDDWQAGLLPEAKRAALDQYRARHGAVAMVGDGLNDGPGLAWADVGIAVGSATDLARETADLVLPVDGLWLLPWVVGRARAVRSTILANLAWAFGYNLIALTCAVLGLLQPILAAAVMAGSSLLVVLNSLRLERLPGPSYPERARVHPRPRKRRSEPRSREQGSTPRVGVAQGRVLKFPEQGEGTSRDHRPSARCAFVVASGQFAPALRLPRRTHAPGPAPVLRHRRAADRYPSHSGSQPPRSAAPAGASS